MEIKKIRTQLDDESVTALKSGDKVCLGPFYSKGRGARAVHGGVREGSPCPSTSRARSSTIAGRPRRPRPRYRRDRADYGFRMDAYAPTLLALGIKGMIAKGSGRRQ